MINQTVNEQTESNSFAWAKTYIDNLVETAQIRTVRTPGVDCGTFPPLPGGLALWQGMLLFSSEKERDRVTRICGQIDNAAPDEVAAIVERLRDSVVQKVTHQKRSKREQRFCVFLLVEMVRAGGYSQDEAINCVSEHTR